MKPPPPPVDEAPRRSQVDEPSTRRRLRPVPPPLRQLTRRLNAFCSIASTYFWHSFQCGCCSIIALNDAVSNSVLERLSFVVTRRLLAMLLIYYLSAIAIGAS